MLEWFHICVISTVNMSTHITLSCAALLDVAQANTMVHTHSAPCYFRGAASDTHPNEAVVLFPSMDMHAAALYLAAFGYLHASDSANMST